MEKNTCIFFPLTQEVFNFSLNELEPTTSESFAKS